VCSFIIFYQLGIFYTNKVDKSAEAKVSTDTYAVREQKARDFTGDLQFYVYRPYPLVKEIEVKDIADYHHAINTVYVILDNKILKHPEHIRRDYCASAGDSIRIRGWQNQLFKDVKIVFTTEDESWTFTHND